MVQLSQIVVLSLLTFASAAPLRMTKRSEPGVDAREGYLENLQKRTEQQEAIALRQKQEETARFDEFVRRQTQAEEEQRQFDEFIRRASEAEKAQFDEFVRRQEQPQFDEFVRRSLEQSNENALPLSPPMIEGLPTGPLPTETLSQLQDNLNMEAIPQFGDLSQLDNTLQPPVENVAVEDVPRVDLKREIDVERDEGLAAGSIPQL